MSVSVQLDTPDAPRVNGLPVYRVSWCAARFASEVGATFTVYAHHPGTDEPRLSLLLQTEATTTPDLPAWVPRPPSGWLASLRMTAEPDPIPQSATIDAAESLRAYLEREGRL